MLLLPFHSSSVISQLYLRRTEGGAAVSSIKDALGPAFPSSPLCESLRCPD